MLCFLNERLLNEVKQAVQQSFGCTLQRSRSESSSLRQKAVDSFTFNKGRFPRECNDPVINNKCSSSILLYAL